MDAIRFKLALPISQQAKRRERRCKLPLAVNLASPLTPRVKLVLPCLMRDAPRFLAHDMDPVGYMRAWVLKKITTIVLITFI